VIGWGFMVVVVVGGSRGAGHVFVDRRAGSCVGLNQRSATVMLRRNLWPKHRLPVQVCVWIRLGGGVQGNQLLQEGRCAVPARHVSPLLQKGIRSPDTHSGTAGASDQYDTPIVSQGFKHVLNNLMRLAHHHPPHSSSSSNSAWPLTMHSAAMVSSCAAAKRAGGPAAVCLKTRPISSSAVSGSSASRAWQYSSSGSTRVVQWQYNGSTAAVQLHSTSAVWQQ
jgi:hypothetical protein